MVTVAEAPESVAGAARAELAAMALRQARLDCAAYLATGGVFVVVTTSQGEGPWLPPWLPLHEEDCRKAERYVCEADRANFIAGRQLLAGLVQGGREMPRLQISPSGKPLPVRGIHFNLSHSERMVAIALTRTGPLGVDIETAARFARHATFADRICHPDEKAWVHAATDPQTALLRRLEVWTRKEAFLKATGAGMGFDAVRVSTLAPLAAFDPAATVGYALRSYVAPGGTWLLSVAHQSRLAPRLVLLDGAAVRFVQIGAPCAATI